MPPEQIALVLSIASFIGVIVGPVAANIISARQVAADRRANHLRERQLQLERKLDILIKMRARLQHLQGATHTLKVPDREEAYGRAYAVMKSVNDPKVRALASDVMSGHGYPDTNEKLPAIDEAIERIGTMLDDLMRQND